MTTLARRNARKAARDEKLAQTLRDTSEAIAAAHEALQAAKRARLDAVADALDVGWSQARVATELGVSQQRVAKMIRDAS